MTALIGLALLALACYLGHRLRSLHGPAYPTAFVLGEGTRTSPHEEARMMRREKWTTRGGVEVE